MGIFGYQTKQIMKKQQYISFDWDGWVYISNGKSQWKERHNPNVKDFSEKVEIGLADFTKAAKERNEVFGKVN